MRYLKDIFFTDTFLVRGHVNTGRRRLTTFLNGTTKRFIEVEEATLIGNADGKELTTPRVLLRLHEIILAHELDDTGRDDNLKAMVQEPRGMIRVGIYFDGKTSIEVSGKIRRRAYERGDMGTSDFIVIRDPMVEGLDRATHDEHSVLKNLPYVIVNRGRISFAFG